MKINPGKYSFFIFLALLLLIAGCGLKSNPVPQSSVVDYRQLVGNIEAASADDGVVLKWDFYNKRGVIKNIFIERSDLGSAGNECKDCPRTFERIGEVQVSQSSSQSAAVNKHSFADKKVEHGKIYNYRLILCDDAGVCQEKYGAEINYE